MKEILIGTVKACLYMGTLIGFKTYAQIDIVGVLAVGAILRHFIDKEQLNK